VTNASRIGRLCVITDVTVQSRFTHDELAALAVEGGADMIQLRDKHLDDDTFIAVARRVREVCARAAAILIINDRVAVARQSGADGVHLGRDDTSLTRAREILGPDIIIGGTAGNLDDAHAAEDAGADYIGFGHIFPTSSKHKPGPPVGLDGLARVCERVRVPILAIGGITADNARACIDAGARGVAVIAAVCAAPDPPSAARIIRERLPD
jgi:thiamine-phosphate pyrophosphorylase